MNNGGSFIYHCFFVVVLKEISILAAVIFFKEWNFFVIV